MVIPFSNTLRYAGSGCSEEIFAETREDLASLVLDYREVSEFEELPFDDSDEDCS